MTQVVDHSSYNTTGLFHEVIGFGGDAQNIHAIRRVTKTVLDNAKAVTQLGQNKILPYETLYQNPPPSSMSRRQHRFVLLHQLQAILLSDQAQGVTPSSIDSLSDTEKDALRDTFNSAYDKATKGQAEKGDILALIQASIPYIETFKDLPTDSSNLNTLLSIVEDELTFTDGLLETRRASPPLRSYFRSHSRDDLTLVEAYTDILHKSLPYYINHLQNSQNFNFVSLLNKRSINQLTIKATTIMGHSNVTVPPDWQLKVNDDGEITDDGEAIAFPMPAPLNGDSWTFVNQEMYEAATRHALNTQPSYTFNYRVDLGHSESENPDCIKVNDAIQNNRSIQGLEGDQERVFAGFVYIPSQSSWLGCYHAEGDDSTFYIDGLERTTEASTHASPPPSSASTPSASPVEPAQEAAHAAASANAAPTSTPGNASPLSSAWKVAATVTLVAAAVFTVMTLAQYGTLSSALSTAQILLARRLSLAVAAVGIWSTAFLQRNS